MHPDHSFLQPQISLSSSVPLKAATCKSYTIFYIFPSMFAIHFPPPSTLMSEGRLYCPQLPLAFVFGATSADVLHTLLPRQARALLSVTTLSAPDGQELFDGILNQVSKALFAQTPHHLNLDQVVFPRESSPLLVLSKPAIEWMYHSCSSYNWSVQAIQSHLQVCDSAS